MKPCTIMVFIVVGIVFISKVWNNNTVLFNVMMWDTAFDYDTNQKQ
ncbi:MAG: hypothetical protein KFH87_10400 [Bacteroidetes bacterium]|nr:hypothetical protein [Bacteroidota bacterium]